MTEKEYDRLRYWRKTCDRLTDLFTVTLLCAYLKKPLPIRIKKKKKPKRKNKLVKTRLWFIRDSDSGMARLYSKLPPERNPTAEDQIWIPRSVIEHTTKHGEEHHLTIADWWADKNDL